MSEQSLLQPPSRLRLLKIITVIAVIFSVAQTLYAGWIESETLDEPFHLGWNERLLNEGITERYSVYNYMSTTPVLLINIAFRRAVESFMSVSPQGHLYLTRMPSVLWLIGTLLAAFFLARRVAGVYAAHLAVIALALDPNLMAHSSLATVDAAYTCATTSVFLALVILAQNPGLKAAALVGAALGFALTVKLSAVLLVVAFGSIFLLYPAAPPLSWRGLGRGLSYLAFMGVIAALIICAGYLFIDVGIPLSKIKFQHRLFQGLATAFPDLRLPLPADFLTGIDYCMGAGGRSSWNVIMFQEWYDQGVWFYFLVLWLLKTPLFILLSQITGLFAVVRRGIAFTNPGIRFLFVNFLFYALYFSFLFRVQVGYRYVLMALPLGYIVAAAGLVTFATDLRRIYFAVAIFAVTLFEVGMYTGNPISFTNLGFWPKVNAFRILADSNIDWGQNRWKLPTILKEHGIESSREDPVHILAGHNTFSVNTVNGVLWNFEQHRWVRENLDPSGHFLHTFLWYDVSDEMFQRFLGQERTYSDATSFLQRCRGVPTTPVLGSRPLQQGDKQLTALCLKTPEKATIRIWNRSGEFVIGPRQSLKGCVSERVHQGKEVWYKLEAGLHEFCIEPAFPYQATLEVKSGTVEASELVPR